MANLGELYDFLTPEDISLTINGIEYKIEPSADVVLRFIADYNSLETFDDTNIAKISAPSSAPNGRKKMASPVAYPRK